MTSRSWFAVARAWVVAVGAMLAGVLLADEARAEKRVALIIGNSAYQNVVKLDNPFNDASAIAEMFRKSGFDSVELKLDLGVIEFKRALRDFYNTTRDADVAVVYYAGHGIEVGGVNYMVPTDAKLRSDYDAEDEAVALERIFRSIESTRRLRLVILDACRDNPFARTMQRQIASRAVTQGLAKIEPMGTDTLVAYAAKAGSTAEDGAGRNSPFTQALVNNLTIPGLDIRIALGRVRDEVLKRTNNRQEPFVYGSLGGATVSLVPEPEKKPVAQADPRGDYELAERVGTASAWDSFLAVHGTGFYAELARQQRAKLAAAAVRPDAMTVAALDRSTPPQRPPEEADRATPDRLAWDKLQDSTDPVAIRAFIKRYPTSPLAVVAQSRLEIIERAIADRKREELERQRFEREAVRQREEEERRLKAAAEEEAKRAKAAAEAEARRAKAAAEAEARAQREAARQREEQERLARLSEAERLKAEREAQRRREDEDKRAKAAAEAADRQAKAAAEAEEKRAKAAAEAEAKAQREAALKLEQERNTPKELSPEELVRSAQIELRRLGCYEGEDNGVLNDATRRGLQAYRLSTGHGKSESGVSGAELKDLQQQRPIGNCLAALEPPKDVAKPKPATAERPAPEKKKPEVATRREKPEPKHEAKPEPKREARPAPVKREPPRAQATAARPAAPARSGGGGAVMHGIGF